ncbi:MAG: hypothetical protein RLZZ46_427 [Bacteroidota bacterium]|jgi:hypothetical protein
MIKKNLILFTASAGLFFSLNATAQHTFVFKTGETKSGTLVNFSNGIVTYSVKGVNKTCSLTDLQRIELEQSMPVVTSGTAPVESADEQTITVGKFSMKYSMKGRNIINKPKIENLTEEKGSVVVEVSIDKYGNVISAFPGSPGSTTNSKYLYTKAEQAAKSVKFDTSPTAPLKTSGTITVIF